MAPADPAGLDPCPGGDDLSRRGREGGRVGAASHSLPCRGAQGLGAFRWATRVRRPRRGFPASEHRDFAPLLSPPREGGLTAPAARGTPAHGGCSAPPPRAQRCRRGRRSCGAALTQPGSAPPRGSRRPRSRAPSPPPSPATGGACVTPSALPAAALCNPPLGPAYKTPPRQSRRHSERRGSREVTARAGLGRGGGAEQRSWRGRSCAAGGRGLGEESGACSAGSGPGLVAKPARGTWV